MRMMYRLVILGKLRKRPRSTDYFDFRLRCWRGVFLSLADQCKRRPKDLYTSKLIFTFLKITAAECDHLRLMIRYQQNSAD